MRILQINTEISHIQFTDLINSMTDEQSNEIESVYTFPCLEAINSKGNLIMYGIVSDDDYSLIKQLYQKYEIVISEKDLTQEVLTGSIIFASNDELSKYFIKSVNEFRLNNCTIDDVLDKILETGIDSLNCVDYMILRAK